MANEAPAAAAEDDTVATGALGLKSFNDNDAFVEGTKDAFVVDTEVGGEKSFNDREPPVDDVDVVGAAVVGAKSPIDNGILF